MNAVFILIPPIPLTRLIFPWFHFVIIFKRFCQATLKLIIGEGGLKGRREAQETLEIASPFSRWLDGIIETKVQPQPALPKTKFFLSNLYGTLISNKRLPDDWYRAKLQKGGVPHHAKNFLCHLFIVE